MLKNGIYCSTEQFRIISAMSLKVDKPSSFLLASASGVRKTFWIFRLIEHRDEIFTQKIERILYFYEVWQPLFEEYNGCVEFFQGAPSVETLKSPERKLVVVDDLMNSNIELITKIFTVYSHHHNFSVLFTAQNIFNKQICEISLNAKFVVLFKNCRDLRQIECFLRQAFPSKFKSVFQAYINETRAPNSYLFFDFRCDALDNQ